MKINLKVRIKNPMFWVGIISAIVLTVFAQMGIQFNDITTWSGLFNVFYEAIKNPVVVVAVLTSAFNAIIDPTTAGISDSKEALSYTKPKGE